MFESITRMFGTDNAEADEEQDAEMGGQPPAELGEQGAGLGEVGTDQPVDDGPDGGELDVRIDELSEDLEATESSVRELRTTQEEMSQSIAEMNDTVRQLVGIYDRLAAEENPFVDGPTEATGGAPVPDADGGHVPETADAHAREDDHNSGVEEDHDGEASADPVVSFDDLEGQPDSEQGQDGESADPTDPQDDGRPGNPLERGTAASPSGTDGAERGEPVSVDGAILESVPDGYAGDVLLMEWLAALMDRAGPAGALRAVNHYETVGWVSPAVEDQLVDIIGGPGLDVFVDPTRPQEPTAEEHALSNEYLRVLEHLTEV